MGIYFHVIDSSYIHQNTSFNGKWINSKIAYDLSDDTLYFMGNYLRTNK